MDLQLLTNPFAAAIISGLVASAVSVFFGQRYAAKLSADAVKFAAETNRSTAMGIADVSRETARLVERDKHRVAWRRALIEPFLETVMKRNDMYSQIITAVERGNLGLAQEKLSELGTFEGVQRAGAFNAIVEAQFRQAIRGYWAADHGHFDAAAAYVANPSDLPAQRILRQAAQTLGSSTILLFRLAEEYVLERVDEPFVEAQPSDTD